MGQLLENEENRLMPKTLATPVSVRDLATLVQNSESEVIIRTRGLGIPTAASDKVREPVPILT